MNYSWGDGVTPSPHHINGFAKKTQKTPSQEIELAEKRKKDYLSKKVEKQNDE
jgi:phage-related protein